MISSDDDDTNNNNDKYKNKNHQFINGWTKIENIINNKTVKY